MTGDNVNIVLFFFSGEILRLFLSAVCPAVCGGHRHHDCRPHEQVGGGGDTVRLTLLLNNTILWLYKLNFPSPLSSKERL